MARTADGDGFDERRPSMKTVALRAGVGVGTVSRVVTNSGQVSAGTRAKVEAAIKELNYRPSALGRGLAAQRTSNIGLIVADISNHYYGAFARGVLAAARGLGRHVSVGSSGEDPTAEREYIELFLEQRVEGIIAFPHAENLELWRDVQGLDVGIVFGDRTLRGIDVPSVVVDNVGGSRALTRHLLELGHRRIGYLGGPRWVTSGAEREEGFRSAHAAAGIEVVEPLVVESEFTSDHAFSNAQRILSAPQTPTAIFASNNVLGEAALAAIIQHGLRIPEDISFAMFDDVPWASLTTPRTTVVSQPVRWLGEEAARLVVAGARSDVAFRAPTEVIVRGSTAPPSP